ncbi:hypothetical protein DWQ67_03810 [Galactobacter caseinivorans]|uniref:Uncharacterized protein n=1 Tax=Galactobacter caseinivorans TaxID=2676123 RepID=A0A496PKC5_9MICC|nr:hypothetical protein DWQ67_03810 [Galactobacter caseinivorans]
MVSEYWPRVVQILMRMAGPRLSKPSKVGPWPATSEKTLKITMKTLSGKAQKPLLLLQRM